MIYHMTSNRQWENSCERGFYSHESLQREGFIHCSNLDQVLGVANAFYRDMEDIVLLEIDENRVTAEIRHENLEGGTSLFPHVYGVIPVDCVSRILEFNVDEKGDYTLCKELR